MNMHWCTARLNLSGQNYYIHDFLATDPISWPEAQLLMALHGEENIYDIKPCGVSNSSPGGEKRRLLGKYASQAKIVEAVFPGRTPRMEMTMPGEPEDHSNRLDMDGQPIRTDAPVGGNGDDEDDDGDGQGREMPTGPAIFKPRETPRGP